MSSSEYGSKVAIATLAALAALPLPLMMTSCRPDGTARNTPAPGRDAGPVVFIDTPPVADDPDAGPFTPPEAGSDEPATPAPNTRLADWGIEYWAPPDSTSDRQPERIQIVVPNAGTIHLELATPAALATREEAAKSWDSGTETRSLGDGTTPAGVMYAIRSFQIREGVPSSRPGRHLHRLTRVSRVHALFTVDEKRQVWCTGYIEHDVELSDASLKVVRDVCLSMQKLR